MQVMNEREERLSYGFNLTTAALALQQDHHINQSKEDRFLISGLKQAGPPAVGPAALKSAGRLIMASLLEVVFKNSEHPIIRDVLLLADLI
jgi:hypothetical protein